MGELEQIYNDKCKSKSDINEHLSTLKKYSEECEHITEMGVRGVVSTYAFMMGKPKKLISIDIESIENYGVSVEFLKNIAIDNGLEFEFITADTTKIEIEETDLLFIDTEHNYLQLKTELLKHGNKSKKYLIFHDTVTFGHKDSNAYGHFVNLVEIKPGDKTKHGLIPAIEEFISDNPQWKIHENYTNNNGLMILKRN